MLSALARLKAPWPHALLVGTLCMLLAVVEHANGRFDLYDLQVYHGAASDLLAGRPVYGVSHGLDSGVFKYAPAMALAFVPLALLPFPVAALLHFAAIAVAFVAAMHWADRGVRTHFLNGAESSSRTVLLATLVTVVHLHRELTLGNINVLLLTVLLAAAALLLKGRDAWGGLLVGMAVVAKPHFALLVPLLLVRGRWKALTAAAGAVAVCLLAPAAVLGWAGNLALHREWVDQMARHNARMIHLPGDSYENVNTLYTLLHRWVLGPLGASGGRAEVLGILAMVALLVGAWVIWRVWADRQQPERRNAAFLAEWYLLLALVPSLTVTDTEHFLLALPLVLWLLHHLAHTQVRWQWGLGALILFAHGGNWEDLWGPWSDVAAHASVLGAANVALVVWCILLASHRAVNLSVARSSS